MSRGLDRLILWCYEPTPVLAFAKQGGKTSCRVKSRPAQPINRAIAPDQGDGLAVANHRIIFDFERHLMPRLTECKVRAAAPSPDDSGSRMSDITESCAVKQMRLE
jgi:hypothetical protein